MARLPEKMKVRGVTGKYLLRVAFAGELPPTVGARGKQGFGIPVGTWFRGELSAWTREILFEPGTPLQTWFNRSSLEEMLSEHSSGRADHGERIYALAMLGLWA